MGKSASKHEEYDRDSVKCHGFVEKFNFQSGSATRYYFILKSDSLSYCETKSSPPLFVLPINKNFKILYDDLEKREVGIECIGEQGENSIWKLIFSSRQSAEKWITKLRRAVRPVWEDAKSHRCSVCDKTFQLFRRQHHCRKCGRVMCMEHCKVVNELPELGYFKKVKICTTCINRLGNFDGVQRARSLTEKEVERKTVNGFNSVLLPYME